MNFAELMLPVKRESVFDLPGHFVWCGSMAKGEDGKYYLYFSFWPESKGFDAWVTHSQVGYAVSDFPEGPYEYGGIALAGAGGDSWDRDVIHNPSVIQWQGKYFLYYMGNYGDGSFWSHRNNQRVGVAWAEKPQGPFHRLDAPVMGVTPGAHDAVMTSNPSVAVNSEGKFIMIYKAVGDIDEGPRFGPVVCGIAFADHPLGPFTRQQRPIMSNPEHSWSVEDPYVWYQDGQYYALVKDFQGYFCGGAKGATALFVSPDGENWQPSPHHPLAVPLCIEWADGTSQPVHRLERPQLWLENGKPRVLFCACMESRDTQVCYNVHIPLKG